MQGDFFKFKNIDKENMNGWEKTIILPPETVTDETLVSMPLDISMFVRAYKVIRLHT